MIPKIIHYVWFGGNELGEKEKKCIESWKKLLPDYKIMRWDDSKISGFKNEYFEQAYKNKQYAFRIPFNSSPKINFNIVFICKYIILCIPVYYVFLCKCVLFVSNSSHHNILI